MPPVRVSDDAFCIAVLGDFLGEDSGVPTAAEVAWEPRRATPDTVFGLTGLRPRLQVSMGGAEAAEEVEFSGLDSFDPGDLFRRMDLFAPLREAREAAKKGPPASDSPVGGAGPSTGLTEGESGATPGVGAGSGGGLLDAILDQTQPSPPGDPARPSGEPGTKEELDAFVREVVRHHRIQPDEDLPSRVARVDGEASSCMSDLLHSPSFKGLEALWRSLVVLLSRIDTTGKVRVYLVHLPKAELERDLLGVQDQLPSKLHGLLSAPRLGVPGRRWAVAVGAYEFHGVPDDIRLLEKIAGVAQAADVPWLSSVHIESGGPSDQEVGGSWSEFRELPEEWTRLRESPEAGWLGLSYPRFLVREPYGGSPRHSKVFDFKETATEGDHLLWGEGAFLCAALLAQGFAESGWGFRPEAQIDLGGMPLASFGEGPEEQPTSVEKRLTVPQAEGLARLGLIPLLGSPERAGIRVGGFRSVAASGESLGAWWKE